MKLSMSRADIIKEGRLSKPWKYFDVAWNSSSSKYNIDGLYGFQSFPLTVKSSLKNQSIEVRRIQRLAFFFQWATCLKRSSKWAFLLSFWFLLTEPISCWETEPRISWVWFEKCHQWNTRKGGKGSAEVHGEQYLWLIFMDVTHMLKSKFHPSEEENYYFMCDQNLHNIGRYL